MRSIIFQASSKCIYNCYGCYSFIDQNSNKCSSAIFIKFVKNLINNYGLKKITISGGEPLIRPDLIQLIKELKYYNVSVNLDTVGLMLLNKYNYNDILNLCLNIDYIGVPLDGSNENIFNEFRNGISYKGIIKVLEILEKVNAKICINTVCTSKNVNNLGDIYRIIKQYKNIYKWQIFQYMPIGPKGYKNRKKFMISESTFVSAIKKAENLCKNITIEAKSAENRKNNYLIISDNGNVWIPVNTNSEKWLPDDVNKNRKIIGNILDKNIIKKVGLINESL